LDHKAKECVDFTIGPIPLSIVGWILDENDPETAAAKKLIKGLHSIRIRNYEFESENAYSKDDIEAVRAQLNAPGWSRLIQVRDRDAKEDIDVFIAYEHDKIVGLAIVATEPREFSIINIVGEIDLDQLATLQKHISLPDSAASRFAMRGR
jgi:hypothetical protein